MQKIWQEVFNVHTYEVDALGRMSLPVLGNMLQEAASRHASHLGWGYDALISQQCIWVLTALRIDLDRDPRWNDTITIDTWPSGRNRLYYHRDFRIKNQMNECLGTATTNWIIIDIKTRKPARVEIPQPVDYNEMERLYESQPRKWPVSDEMHLIETIGVRFDDLDINHHVNNIRYFDWMMRSIDSEFRRNHRMKTFEIHFLSEATDRDTVQISLHQGVHRIQHLLTRTQDDKSLTQAFSEWESMEDPGRDDCCIKRKLREEGIIDQMD